MRAPLGKGVRPPPSREQVQHTAHFPPQESPASARKSVARKRAHGDVGAKTRRKAFKKPRRGVPGYGVLPSDILNRCKTTEIPNACEGIPDSACLHGVCDSRK